MNDVMIKYAQQLKRLVDDYYHQQVTAEDYRAQRKSIFDHIEQDLAGDKPGVEPRITATEDETTPH
jgi:hypothetical protein